MCGNAARAFGPDLDRMLENLDGMRPKLDASALHPRWNDRGLLDDSFGFRVE